MSKISVMDENEAALFALYDYFQSDEHFQVFNMPPQRTEVQLDGWYTKAELARIVAVMKDE